MEVKRYSGSSLYGRPRKIHIQLGLQEKEKEKKKKTFLEATICRIDAITVSMRYNDLYYNDKSFYNDNLTAKILVSYSNQGAKFPVCPLSGDIFKYIGTSELCHFLAIIRIPGQKSTPTSLPWPLF